MSTSQIQLSPNEAAFCDLFPKGRLCRLINRRSGTLLDIQPNLNLVNDNVPQVETQRPLAFNTQWIITPHGDGQAIIPVPRDGSSAVRYLSASSINTDRAVTVSPFPASWSLFPTSDCPKLADSPLTAASTPPGVYEEWTCQISWPHFRNTEPRMLDLYAGTVAANTKVVLYPYSGSQWQFWLVQFLRYNSRDW
ncbi:hypothetical protein C8R43DRAFT_1119049 [Mycena crocata]|nr:hypothetical protein C8R43DRAFT_1119049 [Mycena crocata]